MSDDIKQTALNICRELWGKEWMKKPGSKLLEDRIIEALEIKDAKITELQANLDRYERDGALIKSMPLETANEIVKLEAQIAALKENSNVKIVEVWMKKLDVLEAENQVLRDQNALYNKNYLELQAELATAKEYIEKLSDPDFLDHYKELEKQIAELKVEYEKAWRHGDEVTAQLGRMLEALEVASKLLSGQDKEGNPIPGIVTNSKVHFEKHKESYAIIKAALTPAPSEPKCECKDGLRGKNCYDYHLAQGPKCKSNPYGSFHELDGMVCKWCGIRLVSTEGPRT